MAFQGNQKPLILELLKLFERKTDSTHGLTASEICAYLQEKGFSVDRRNIYSGVEILSNAGYDIQSDRIGNYTYYHLVSRTFDLDELQLLADMVKASKFISEKKEKIILKKLQELTSEDEGKILIQQVMVSGKSKTKNESIFRNSDKLHKAIAEDRKIHFHYWNWNMKKEEENKYDGKLYEVSPWILCWDNEKYYMLAYDAEAGKIKNYRVDKMKDIDITMDPREGVAELGDVDVQKYLMSMFGMFGGEPEEVELISKNYMIGVLIDRFGTDIDVNPVDEDHFTTHVNIALSDQFYGWVMGLGGGVRISKPEKAVQGLKALVEKFI